MHTPNLASAHGPSTKRWMHSLRVLSYQTEYEESMAP
jgi:hypothetical protein